MPLTVKQMQNSSYLPSFVTFIEVDTNSLKLVIIVTNVFSRWVNTVLGRHNLKAKSREVSVKPFSKMKCKVLVVGSTQKQQRLHKSVKDRSVNNIS